MSKVNLDISMSLDGYVAGPDADLENPLGVGGMQLHEWVFGLDSQRKTHGQEGGATNVDDDVKVEPDRVIESPNVTHVRYRVVKSSG